MVTRREDGPLAWQSKVILLLVLPWTAGSVILQAHWWLTQVPVVAYQTLGISAIFGLVVWRLRAGTPAAAATGALITASLMFSTTQFPYKNSWLHGGLMPLLAVFLLTYAATKIGKSKKERLGISESKRGRNSAQVAANLGVAALVAQLVTLLSFRFMSSEAGQYLAFIAALAALAEAAADTVSSEIGQAAAGQPRMITTFRKVSPGTDGGVTLAGTSAGVLASFIVAAIGGWCIHAERSLFGSLTLIALIASGGIIGLLFDSLLGATLERKGWLNNDSVNFLSTLIASLCSVAGICYFVSIIKI